MWIDVLKGEPVSFKEIVKDLEGVKVVYIGETHTIRRHHEIQESLIKALCGAGKKILLGLEQMESINQVHLDRYNNKIDFETLAANTDWEKRWSNYRDYRNVLETVKSCGGRVIALNAQLETIRAVARDGLSLHIEKKTLLPHIALYPDALYEAYLQKIMNVHGFMHHPKMLKNMVDAQIVRDEAMAQNLNYHMKKEEHREYLSVVLAGSGHVSFGMGIPDRLRKRFPGIRDRIVLVSESGDLHLDARNRPIAREIELSHEDLKAIGRPLADYIHISEPATNK